MGSEIIIAAILLLCWMICLVVVDIREHRLPNILTIPGGIAIIASASLHNRGVAAVLGALVLAGLYLIVYMIFPNSLGAGDIKLAIGLGAITAAVGIHIWILAALLSSLLTALIGIVLLLFSIRSPIPHGPSMCLGTLISLSFAVA